MEALAVATRHQYDVARSDLDAMSRNTKVAA